MQKEKELTTYEGMRAPVDDDGFVQSFAVDDREGQLEFFRTFGFVVVRDVFSPEQIQVCQERPPPSVKGLNLVKNLKMQMETRLRWTTFGILWRNLPIETPERVCTLMLEGSSVRTLKA